MKKHNLKRKNPNQKFPRLSKLEHLKRTLTRIVDSALGETANVTPNTAAVLQGYPSENFHRLRIRAIRKEMATLAQYSDPYWYKLQNELVHHYGQLPENERAEG